MIRNFTKIFLTYLAFTLFCAYGHQLPLVINTWAFEEANAAAWHVLQTGGSALDALVEGCSTCEQLQCDGTVGYGGSPDENGDTTLDAMVMDGANMNIGAVAGMRDIKSAAQVARLVLLHTKHTLLVGDSATNFAIMMGFKRESLKTPKSQQMWREWLENKCQPNFWLNVVPKATKKCGPYKPEVGENMPDKHSYYSYKVDRWNHDTIGMIVIDKDANIFAGTSTNGAKHKIPGRVGDSPIPGAGAYADNEVGAAVATGDGDVMMRFLPSFLAVESLRLGMAPKAAADNSMQRIVKYYPNFSGGLVVTDKKGRFAASCAGIDKFPYSITFGTKVGTEILYENCTDYIKSEL